MVMKKNMSREKCNGGGVIVFYKKWLNPYFVIMKCCVDCMIWFKLDKCIMSDDKNLYMCAIYIPPDKNVFYRKYECDIFQFNSNILLNKCINTIYNGIAHQAYPM
jgi:hypothetical protein